MAFDRTAGEVHIYRSRPGDLCHSEQRCSQLSSNTANGTDAGFAGGGGILAVGGSIRITGTYIEDNRANYGSAIRARFIPLDGFDRNINIIGNVFATNENAPQVVYLDESDADMGFNTFVNNTGNDRIIEIAYPDTPLDAHEVRIFGSIFCPRPARGVRAGRKPRASASPPPFWARNEAKGKQGDPGGGGANHQTTPAPSFLPAGGGPPLGIFGGRGGGIIV